MEPVDPKTKQPKSTGFTNINDIVRANRENRLGSAVSSGVKKTVDKGQEDLSGVRQQFQQQSQAGAIGSDADKTYAQQTIQNAGQNPQAQADVDRFARLRSGQYQGPQGLGNQEQLQAQQQDLQGIANASTNQYGQRGLLQRFVGQPEYTQGQQRLDNLLLGQTGAQGLRQSRQAAGQFGQQLTNAQSEAQAQAQGLRQQSQQFGQQVGKDLGIAQEGLSNQLISQRDQAQLQSQATRDALMALLSKPNQAPATPAGEVTTMPIGGRARKSQITQQQYDLASQLLGNKGFDLNRSGYGRDQDFFLENPENVVGGNVPQATLQNTASDQNKQRSLALSKLSGQTPTDFQEDTQVGGYNPLEFLNQDNFNKFLKENEAKNTFDASTINNASDNALQGSYNKSDISKQGQAIGNLAQQLQITDPNKSSQYTDLANQLNAYGSGGKGYLWGYDNKARYENLYKEILNSGLADKYENNKVSLNERLKRLING